MKKILTLSLAFSLVSSVWAQNVNVTKPQFVNEFSVENVCATGISADGSVVYGSSLSGEAAFYDFNRIDNPFYKFESGPEDVLKLGLTVAGITSDGKSALVCDYLNSYFYDLTTGVKTFLKSPDPEYGVNAWDMSDDATIIGCNLTSANFIVIPMVGKLQEDGTYKLEYLPYGEKDAMGCYAQYSQVRAVSNDGQYIMGVQPDDRGMGGRLVVWVRQADGSYEFTTPIDEFLYDYTYEKPGFAPEWDDYVTADPDAEPELWESQAAEFDKAFDEYEINYKNFTRGYSFLDVFSVHKATDSNIMCMGLKDNRDPMKGGMLTPVFYDCETNEVTDYPSISGDAFGFEELPGGGHIYAKKASDLCSLVAVDKDGNERPFEEWLEDVTGTDLTEDYKYTFYDYMNDVEVTGVFFGRPYFSADGKSLMFSGMNPDTGEFLTSVIRFDSNIFESVTTGIKVNITDKVIFSGSTVSLGKDSHGVADIYTLDGTRCASCSIDGMLNLKGVVSPGTYVVKVSVSGKQPVSMKIIVK